MMSIRRLTTSITLLILFIGLVVSLGTERTPASEAASSLEPKTVETERSRLSDAQPGSAASDPMASPIRPAVTSASEEPDTTTRDDDATPRTEASPDAGSPTGRDEDTRDEPLDRAPIAVVLARLNQAVLEAQAERSLYIEPTLIEEVAETGRVRIIAGGMQFASPALANALVGAEFADLRIYRRLPYVAAEIGPQALLKIIELSSVTAIEADEVHRPSLTQSTELVGAAAAVAGGHDGSSFAIAILDTGVDTGHPMFAGRVLDEACFSVLGDCPNGGRQQTGPGAGVPCSFDCDHGTHVAGIALGSDPAAGIEGVAPGAELITIQVFSDIGGQPGAYSSDILAALEHVYDLSLFYPIAAVNMSLGGSTYTSESECDLANGSRKAAIDLLRSADIATIVASGNAGEIDALSSPSCISSAISVGSTNLGDRASWFSNSASFLSLLAPGQGIESAVPSGYASYSGTSMATPHVAGAWASMRGAVSESDVDVLLEALQGTGVPVIDDRNGITTARLSVLDAIEELAAAEEESDPAPGEASEEVPRCGQVGEEMVAMLGFAVYVRRRRRSPAESHCL